MDYLISVSHSDFVRFKGDMDKIAEICTISGFPGIEGYHTIFEGFDYSDLEDAGEILRNANVKTPSFHLPGSVSDRLDLVSPDENTRLGAVEIYTEWMEKAALMGFKKAIIHGTTAHPNVNDTDLISLTDRLLPELEKLLKTAEKNGIILALENQNPSEAGRFGSEPEHLYEILKRINSPFFGFCLDFGHAYINCRDSYNVFYDVMKGKIEAVHLHGNHGTEDIHLPPGYGDTDWDTVRSFLKKINLPYVCIESSPHPSIDHFFPSDWKKLYLETCELLGH